MAAKSLQMKKLLKLPKEAPSNIVSLVRWPAVLDYWGA